MGVVQNEVVHVGQPCGDHGKQVDGQVLDTTAAPALGVRMGSNIVCQVISRGAVAQMDVLHHSQVAQPVKRAIDGRAMNSWVAPSGSLRDLLDPQVPGHLGQHGEHRGARPCHAVALGA